MKRLDIYDNIPDDMRKYLSQYGWHFSKKAYEFAVSKMKDKNNQKLQKMEKDVVESTLKNYNITIDKAAFYDCCYVYSMCMADYYNSSIKDLKNVAMFVKDYIDDPDGYDGIAFTRYYADCIGSGCHLDWESLI